VTLRMTSADRWQIVADAKAAGLSLSAYMLDCWRRARQGE
jgi:hypothetical protein